MGSDMTAPLGSSFAGRLRRRLRDTSCALRQLSRPWQSLRRVCGKSNSWRHDPVAIKCVHCGARYPVKSLPYAIKSDQLPTELQSAWCLLEHDAATETFLEGCFQAWTLYVWLLSLACSILRRSGWSLTDANAVTGRGAMLVLSSAQAELILGRPGGILIDVGAGAGCVTQELAPLFDAVLATEASAPMAQQLKRCGFAVHRGVALAGLRDSARQQGLELGPGASVIALLNVLDRCDRPRSLLLEAAALLRPGGCLLVAVVLPFRPFVEEGTARRAPTEALGLPRDASFETSASMLWKALFEPEGFAVKRFSRVPYLCMGDHVDRCYSLEDSIWVLHKKDAPCA